MSKESFSLAGDVHVWAVGSAERRFSTVTLPYGTARKVFKPDVYDAKTGRGEQRAEIEAHVRAIKRDMLDGNYTPTPVSVGCRERHRANVSVEDGRFRLDVSAGDPLPLTDGHQRFCALAAIAAEAEGEALDKVLALPISATLHIDGQTQQDFLRLQRGRSVAAHHLLSLQVQQKMVKEADYQPLKLAFDVARHLNTLAESPFNRMVRFDTKGIAPLLVTTLCAKGASDLGVSLVGLAKVGLAAGVKDAKRLAFYPVTVVQWLKEKAPELLGDDEHATVLTPPPGGTKGSATMLVGLGVCLAYRVNTLKQELPDDHDLGRMTEAARAALAGASPNLSSQGKRALLREFAAEFFKDVPVAKHDGVPVELLRILSASAFACSPVPKGGSAAPAEESE